MAIYTDGDEKFDCVQLDERRVFQPSGMVGEKGDWVVTDAAGVRKLRDPASFAKLFTQVFPRLPGQDHCSIHRPTSAPPSAA